MSVDKKFSDELVSGAAIRDRNGKIIDEQYATNTRVSGLETTLTSYATKEEVTTLSSAVATTLTTYATEVRVSDIQEQLDMLDEAVATTLTTYATKSEVTTLSSNVATTLTTYAKAADLTTYVSTTKYTGVKVAGTTKTVYKYDKTALYASDGIIMGGTAAAAGLVTRGICGVQTPTSSGAANKDNLYLNYDGNNTYLSNRQVVLQAGTTGTHYGNNLYQYAAARGDAVKNYGDAHWAPKSATATSITNLEATTTSLSTRVGDLETTTTSLSNRITTLESTALTEQAQADWEETDVLAASYIKNRPFYKEASFHGEVDTDDGTWISAYGGWLVSINPSEWTELVPEGASITMNMYDANEELVDTRSFTMKNLSSYIGFDCYGALYVSQDTSIMCYFIMGVDLEDGDIVPGNKVFLLYTNSNIASQINKIIGIVENIAYHTLDKKYLDIVTAISQINLDEELASAPISYLGVTDFIETATQTSYSATSTKPISGQGVADALSSLDLKIYWIPYQGTTYTFSQNGLYVFHTGQVIQDGFYEPRTYTLGAEGNIGDSLIIVLYLDGYVTIFGEYRNGGSGQYYNHLHGSLAERWENVNWKKSRIIANYAIARYGESQSDRIEECYPTIFATRKLLLDSLGEQLEVCGKNLVNHYLYMPGVSLKTGQTTGSAIEYEYEMLSSIKTYYPIKVTPGATYTLSQVYKAQIAFFSNFPSDLNSYSLNIAADTQNYGVGRGSVTITIPSGVNYIILSEDGNGTSGRVQFELGSTATTYESAKIRLAQKYNTSDEDFSLTSTFPVENKLLTTALTGVIETLPTSSSSPTIALKSTLTLTSAMEAQIDTRFSAIDAILATLVSVGGGN